MFQLTIKLGNAAMLTPEDIAGALRDAADAVEHGRTDGFVYDTNGNRVGSWVSE